MILLYTAVLLLLGMITMIVKLRARGLERNFATLARTVDQLVRQPELRAGNSNKVDVCQNAVRAFQLGQLVSRRDKVESRYLSWQRCSERFSGWLSTVRAWKGKKLPYTLGALDVWLLLCFVDYLGVGDYFSTRQVIEHVSTWFRK